MRYTRHSSFSITVGLTALVVTAGALLLASCATSPRDPVPEVTVSKATKADETDSAETTEVATAEKPAPTDTTPDEKEASDSAAGAAAGTTSPAAAPPYPETQEHIQKLEDGLKPLKAIPSKRE